MKNFLSPLFWTIVGTAIVVWSIASSGPLSAFWDIPSVMITFFGSICAVAISFPFNEIKKFPKVMKELLFEDNHNHVELVQTFVELAKKARKQGILSIEEDIGKLDNPMLAKGVQMIVDGKDGESIQDQLELEIDLIEGSYNIAPLLLNKWGEFAPAFGMIGTLIGLIVMLGELDDPSLIGTGMAVALITTFYGSFLSNLVFLPLAINIEQLIASKMVTYDIILEGIISMQAAQNPRDIEEKLKAFLTSKELDDYETKEPLILDQLANQER